MSLSNKGFAGVAPDGPFFAEDSLLSTRPGIGRHVSQRCLLSAAHNDVERSGYQYVVDNAIKRFHDTRFRHAPPPPDTFGGLQTDTG